MKKINDNELRSALAEASEAGKVGAIVKFSTVWCAPCKAVATMLSKLESQYADRIAFIEADAEECADLAVEFGIRSLPIVIAFAGSPMAETERLVGARSQTAYEELIRSLLTQMNG